MKAKNPANFLCGCIGESVLGKRPATPRADAKLVPSILAVRLGQPSAWAGASVRFHPAQKTR